MTQKTKSALFALLLAALLLLSGCELTGDATVLRNNQKLKKSLTSLSDYELLVFLNDTVPFDWDTAYTFGPYTTKEEKEAVIGFASDELIDNYDENLLDLVFVKNGRVVACIIDYPKYLGYNIVLNEYVSDTYVDACRITYREDAVLFVEKEDGIVTLTQL